MKETFIFKLKDDRLLQFKINLFDEEVDVDKILTIDYRNVLSEIITFPVILNRIGIMLADMDNKLTEAKLNYDITKAKQKKIIRSREKLTNDAVIEEWMSSPVYKLKKERLFEAQKNRDFINSLYWSARDKSEKLNKISLSLQSEQLDINNLETSLNGVEVLFRQAKLK